MLIRLRVSLQFLSFQTLVKNLGNRQSLSRLPKRVILELHFQASTLTFVEKKLPDGRSEPVQESSAKICIGNVPFWSPVPVVSSISILSSGLTASFRLAPGKLKVDYICRQLRLCTTCVKILISATREAKWSADYGAACSYVDALTSFRAWSGHTEVEVSDAQLAPSNSWRSPI